MTGRVLTPPAAWNTQIMMGHHHGHRRSPEKRGHVIPIASRLMRAHVNTYLVLRRPILPFTQHRTHQKNLTLIEKKSYQVPGT